MSFYIGRTKIAASYWFFAALAAAAAICRSSIFFCGLAAAVLHETGHILAIAMLPHTSMSHTCMSHTCIRKITFGPLGIKMTADGSTMTPPVIVAGIVFNIAAAASAMIIWRINPEWHAAAQFSAANLCLALCNMLPVEPLDGGLLLRWMLERHLLPDDADRTMLTVSLCVLIPMAAGGLFAVMRSRGNISLLVLCLWLLAGIIRQYI